MSSYDKTLKLVTNLDRAGIESRLAEVRSAAGAAGLAGLVQLLTGIEGAPRAQLEHKVKSAVKWIADGQIVGNEPMLSYRSLPSGARYVRAEISNAEGSTVYTQAFPVRPVGDVDGDYDVDGDDDALC